MPGWLEGLAHLAGPGDGLELEAGGGDRALDVDDQDLAAQLAGEVAEQGDVERVAAGEDPELQVDLAPDVERSPCRRG